MAFQRKSERDEKKARDEKKKKKMRMAPKRRSCRFCADKKVSIDYKNVRALGSFLSERGRLVPRRISGNCSQHQREVTLAVKRARVMALIPFSATQARTHV